MRYVYLLGACGSIGTQTLDIIRKHLDELKLVAISVGHDLNLAKKIIDEFRPQMVCFRKKEDKESFKEYSFIKVFGDEGLNEVASYTKYSEEILVNALVGSAGLKPTELAIKSHKNIALANKETLVMAGDVINQLIDQYDVKLFPIDSEHSAIWQCIQGEKKEEIKSLIITASGGSFRDKTRNQLVNVTKEDALNHPNWKMGPKITIDSATMMNKGFEVMEAHHLFKIEYDQIKTILHKESVIHSMVEFNDGSIKAELSCPDMRGPISYALFYPHHYAYQGESLDLVKISSLHFEELSQVRFPCLSFAYEAGKKGGLYPTCLNAANEIAVHLFLEGKIPFLKIEEIIRQELSLVYDNLNPTIDEMLSLDSEIKKRIRKEFDKSL